jgi:hypothetical protein
VGKTEGLFESPGFFRGYGTVNFLVPDAGFRAGNKFHDNYNDGDHQKDVDKSTERGSRDQTQNPQN